MWMWMRMYVDVNVDVDVDVYVDAGCSSWMRILVWTWMSRSGSCMRM